MSISREEVCKICGDFYERYQWYVPLGGGTAALGAVLHDYLRESKNIDPSLYEHIAFNCPDIGSLTALYILYEYKIFGTKQNFFTIFQLISDYFRAKDWHYAIGIDSFFECAHNYFNALKHHDKEQCQQISKLVNDRAIAFYSILSSLINNELKRMPESERRDYLYPKPDPARVLFVPPY